MMRWFVRLYVWIFRIVAVGYVFLVPFLTISEHLDPWDYSTEIRSAFQDSHFVVVVGGSWRSSVGQHRQVLLLVPRTIAAPIVLEIDMNRDQMVTQSGYGLLLLICAVYAFGCYTIVRLIRSLVLRDTVEGPRPELPG